MIAPVRPALQARTQPKRPDFRDFSAIFPRQRPAIAIRDRCLGKIAKESRESGPFG